MSKRDFAAFFPLTKAVEDIILTLADKKTVFIPTLIKGDSMRSKYGYLWKNWFILSALLIGGLMLRTIADVSTLPAFAFASQAPSVLKPVMIHHSVGTFTGSKSESSAQSSSQTVKDIDGNVYKTIVIGNQVWMIENLKSTKYNDGTPIPKVIDDTQWKNLTTGAYCWPNNYADSPKTPMGALYNWYAVETGILSPTGWHVASDSEWATLATNLGGWEIAGGKLVISGESGFEGFPCGLRDGANGAFKYFGGVAFWWTSTEDDKDKSCFWVIFSGQPSIKKNVFPKGFGFSVRCLKD